MKNPLVILPRLFIGSVILLGMAVLVHATEKPNKESSQPTERVAKLKFFKQSAGKKTASATQVSFQPGKRVDLAAGTKSDDTTTRVEIAVTSKMNELPIEHLIEVKIIEQTGSNQPSIVAAPKVLTIEGQEASIQIGEANGDGIKVVLVVEPVK